MRGRERERRSREEREGEGGGEVECEGERGGEMVKGKRKGVGKLKLKYSNLFGHITYLQN